MRELFIMLLIVAVVVLCGGSLRQYYDENLAHVGIALVASGTDKAVVTLVRPAQ